MSDVLQDIIDRCLAAIDAPDPQAAVTTLLLEVAGDAALADAIAKRTEFQSLEDLAIHRSERLTLLAGSLPPGFRAAPHNHNMWSVVSVLRGQEDNEVFERGPDGLVSKQRFSVIGPGVLPNAPDVIHAICNPIDTPLLALHAYGGDLFGVDRSSWDPETHEEIPFDWRKTFSE